MVEMVAHRLFDQPGGFRAGEAILVWLWNCGSRMKTESISSEPTITSSAVMSLAFSGSPVRRTREAPDQRLAQALFVRAAIGVGMVLQYQL